MNPELTKAAQQALEAFDADNTFALGSAMDRMRRALTQRPAAQDVDGHIAASLGDIVAVWDQHAPSEYMTAIHMQAKRALAGQQPVSPDMHGWCSYVGGMVAHWVTSEPDAHARLGDERFEAAIAGIIERRLWAMPKPAHQQATPEPAGEPAFAQLKQVLDGLDRCYARDSKAEFLRVWIRDWTQHKLEQATRPAPGVPEGFALVPVEPTPEMMEAMPSLPAIGAPGDMELKAKGWSLKAIQNRHRWLAALAAAQAKS